jgi:signal peptidase
MSRKKRHRQSKNHKGTFATVLSVTGTILLIIVIVLCVPLTVPRLFGYEVYTVISGSMEPAIPTGSLVYTKSIAPEDVKNQVVEGKFVTKGDANAKEDAMPTEYSNLLGKVELSVPFMGQILAAVASAPGKIAAVSLIILSVLLHGVAGFLRRNQEEYE